MGLFSNGTLYDIPEGIVYSFPVTISAGGVVSVVEGLPISDFAREKMDQTVKELQDEKEMTYVVLEGGNSEGKL